MLRKPDNKENNCAPVISLLQTHKTVSMLYFKRCSYKLNCDKNKVIFRFGNNTHEIHAKIKLKPRNNSFLKKKHCLTFHANQYHNRHIFECRPFM